MAIVGFSFTNIKAERKPDSVKGKIDIKNNVVLSNVEESGIKMGSASQKVAKISFDFNVSYEPKLGSMKFSGDVLYLGEAAKIDGLVVAWKKDKSLSKEIAPGILNTVLNKCNIQAVIMSQQVNLPSPIPMPKVQIQAPKK
ncbi:hypothetical protein KY332_00295 [Candidatus Woesearchaeota archaeon]|nr:hypothetical protein [Candidatus Woesearchaeota archaeon]